MSFDVLIVGGGPAGLAASIRLKQLCQQHDQDLSVCLIDKGRYEVAVLCNRSTHTHHANAPVYKLFSLLTDTCTHSLHTLFTHSEIGAHILSGNVFDPIALHELFPEKATVGSDHHWTKALQDATGSIATPVQKDVFSILPNAQSAFSIPEFLLPPQLHNHGNYIISLSHLCRWLGQEAEALGVEIYPGFAASQVLLNATQTAVTGVATRDVGVSKDGVTLKPTFERGVALQARQTLLAEGARGSCSEWLQQHFDMRSSSTSSSSGGGSVSADSHPQQYGLGLKEVWQVPPEQFQSGLVQHTLGFPLQSGIMDKVFGGSFLYHQEPDLVLVGLVVGLDYANPYLNPYLEFQKWKTHPAIAKHLVGGTCLSYGARVLNEGGYHAIPSRLTVPGAALIGCSAGFLNAVKIKGSHTAIKSGILAAEATFAALTGCDATVPVSESMELDTESYPYTELEGYTKALQDSWIYKELYEVRNSHMAFSKWGVAGGLIHTALSAHITKGREPWTLHSHGPDSAQTGAAANYQPIDYPPADGKLTFDLLTNLQRSGTNHEEDQPCHLRIKPELGDIPVSTSMQVYAAPEQRFCPAGVYEYVDDTTTSSPNDATATSNEPPRKKLVINAQNCVHCKCCSIKMPHEYIEWTVPEGGGGPQYQVM
jgi:electron-transferring-flavoprotein dehydrogenase